MGDVVTEHGPGGTQHSATSGHSLNRLTGHSLIGLTGHPLDRCVALTRSNLRRGKDRGAPSRGNSLLILSRAKRTVEASLQTMRAASQPLHDGEMIVR